MTTQQEVYIFFNDAGHAWLRVPIAELIGLSIADQISACSYINGKYAYLEEDCDAGVFLRARFGQDITGKKLQEMHAIKDHRTEVSPIRDYDHYSYTKQGD